MYTIEFRQWLYGTDMLVNAVDIIASKEEAIQQAANTLLSQRRNSDHYAEVHENGTKVAVINLLSCPSGYSVTLK